MNQRMAFPSRVDWWLAAIPVIGVAFVIFVGYRLQQIGSGAYIVAFAVAALMVATTLLIAVPCVYVLEADALLIRSGVLRQRIPYQAITNLELSSSPMSSPALSLRRVKVSYGRASRLVSPVDREWFMRAVQERVSRAVETQSVNAKGAA
jgi:membrane protein YdbS with pleckstrin-like domain